jgi:hypothetical protein
MLVIEVTRNPRHTEPRLPTENKPIQFQVALDVANGWHYLAPLEAH